MRSQPRPLGLIGGITSEASLMYERLLNTGAREQLGGIHAADLWVRSYDFDEIAQMQKAGDWDGLGKWFARDALALEHAGAEAIVICANTMHKVAPQIEAAISIPIISVLDVTADAILAAGLDKVALLGTAYTMLDPFYSDHLAARGIEVMAPGADDVTVVHDIIYTELAKGVAVDTSLEALLRVTDALTASGAQGVIAGCTELPMLIRAEHVDVPYFDTTALHAAAAVEWMLAD